MTGSDDKWTREDVIGAALTRLPRGGDERTIFEDVAVSSGTSSESLRRRFGSVQDLRRACDSYVVDTLGDLKGTAIAANSTADPHFLSTAFEIAPPLIRYIAWSVTTGDAESADFFDSLVEQSRHLFTLAEAHGLLTTSSDPDTRAAVVLAMQVGGIVLHEHLSRALGTDVFSPEGLRTLALQSMEVFTRGIFTIEGATETENGVRLVVDNITDGHKGPGL